MDFSTKESQVTEKNFNLRDFSVVIESVKSGAQSLDSLNPIIEKGDRGQVLK